MSDYQKSKELAEQAIATVHGIMTRYMATKKWQLFARFSLRKEYRREIRKAYGICANGGQDEHGEWYGARLQSIAETASMFYGLRGS